MYWVFRKNDFFYEIMNTASNFPFAFQKTSRGTILMKRSVPAVRFLCVPHSGRRTGEKKSQLKQTILEK